MICLECKKTFEQALDGQRFCREFRFHSFHDREREDGLKLTPQLLGQLQELAQPRWISLNEMACIMLHRCFNPDGSPLPDDTVFGVPGKE